MKTNNSKWAMILGSVAMLAMGGQAHSALVFNGEFNMYRPETGFTVTGTFPSDGSYVPGGFGLGKTVGGAPVVFSDSTNSTTTDNKVDVPGWTAVRGGAAGDLYVNGFGWPLDSAFHGFAGWAPGGIRPLLETAGAVGTVATGQAYTITVLVGAPGSPADGPMAGPLEFNLLANGVALTPSSSVNVPGTIVAGTWYTMSRTYSASSLVGNVGEALKIQVGVDPSNSLGDRVIFDNVSLDVVPEPSAALLGGLGLLGLLRRRR